ncbi:Hypothetical protein I595_2837 [Croceitalea dokdonensis DOKDO 023]|uniref:Uncharacterized protein n=1 Tax=Croceitalea dokdonensis DOKDO 023 TaxID=1300341 RepID=A0A0N8H3K9_9FLAO|nr:Hypothetical protein I595_2837 [Croceitalea dokdonensis DOKDO 023]
MAPKANAINVTLKMDSPFNPALAMPIKKAAVKAKTQPIVLGSEKVVARATTNWPS